MTTKPKLRNKLAASQKYQKSPSLNAWKQTWAALRFLLSEGNNRSHAAKNSFKLNSNSFWIVFTFSVPSCLNSRQLDSRVTWSFPSLSDTYAKKIEGQMTQKMTEVARKEHRCVVHKNWELGYRRGT